jgi:hypothetical protein
MFKLFIIAVLFGLILWLAGGYGGARRPGARREDGREARELVRDAQTGVYFPKGESVSVVRGGETLYFLNRENRDKFLSANR